MTSLKSWFTLPLALAMVGCVSMAPKYRVPEPPVPKAWPEGSSYKAVPGETSGQPAADMAWQEFYEDARLRKVLDLALRNNRDLRIAALNTEKARAYYRIQRAEMFPMVNAVGYGSKQRLPASVSGTGQSIIAEQYAANLGISVIPVEVGMPFAAMLGIKVIPLSDSWAQRNFVVCFRDFEVLQPAAQRMVEHLAQCAALAIRVGPTATGRKSGGKL